MKMPSVTATPRDAAAAARAFAIPEMRAAIADFLDAPSLLAMAQVDRAWASTTLSPLHWGRLMGPAPKLLPTRALCQHAAWRSERMAQQREPTLMVSVTALALAAVAGAHTSHLVQSACMASSCGDNPVCEWSGRQKFCEQMTTGPMLGVIILTGLAAGAVLHLLYRALGRQVAKHGQARLTRDQKSAVQSSHYAQHPAQLRLTRWMHKAASQTQALAAVQNLLQLEAPINLPDLKGRTALSCAVHAGQFAAATALVENGAHVALEDLIAACEAQPNERKAFLGALKPKLCTKLVEALPFTKLARWVDSNEVARLEDIIIYVSHDIGRLWLTQPPREGAATLQQRSARLARKGDASMQRVFDAWLLLAAPVPV